LVLKQGKVEEFDTPKNLMDKKDGYFNVLVNENGKSYFEELYKLAK